MEYINLTNKGGETLKKVYYLLTILCLLNLVDYITTILALNNGAMESNAIARVFIDTGNFHWFKLIGISLVCTYLIWRARKDIKSQLRITKLLKWANAAYGLVVIVNIATYGFCKL